MPLRKLGWWLILSGGVYAVAGLAFVLIADQVLGWINALSALLLPGLPLIPIHPQSPERFWLVLAGAMMATIAACGIYGGSGVGRRFELAVPIVVSKLTSTVLGVAFFVGSAPHFAYLVIAATDLPIGIVTWVLYRRAARVVTRGPAFE